MHRLELFTRWLILTALLRALPVLFRPSAGQRKKRSQCQCRRSICCCCCACATATPAPSGKEFARCPPVPNAGLNLHAVNDGTKHSGCVNGAGKCEQVTLNRNFPLPSRSPPSHALFLPLPPPSRHFRCSVPPSLPLSSPCFPNLELTDLNAISSKSCWYPCVDSCAGADILTHARTHARALAHTRSASAGFLGTGVAPRAGSPANTTPLRQVSNRVPRASSTHCVLRSWLRLGQ